MYNHEAFIDERIQTILNQNTKDIEIIVLDDCSKDQSVEKANPKVATAAPPARQKAESVPTTGWAVQLGSFGDKQNAERLASVVSKKGFSTYLMSSQQAGKTLYRVRVGPRDSRAQATELAERLGNAGYKGQVTQQLPDS